MQNFDAISYLAFEEAMTERYDFASSGKKCQRSDGTIYGIPSDSDCGSGRKEVRGDKRTSSLDRIPGTKVAGPGGARSAAQAPLHPDQAVVDYANVSLTGFTRDGREATSSALIYGNSAVRYWKDARNAVKSGDYGAAAESLRLMKENLEAEKRILDANGWISEQGGRQSGTYEKYVANNKRRTGLIDRLISEEKGLTPEMVHGGGVSTTSDRGSRSSSRNEEIGRQMFNNIIMPDAAQTGRSVRAKCAKLGGRMSHDGCVSRETGAPLHAAYR